ANILAARFDSILCSPGKPARDLAVAPCNRGADLDHGDRIRSAATESISRCRLALVFADADSGDRNCAGWIARARRSLHLFAADRIAHCNRVVALGFNETALGAKSFPEQRSDNCNRDVVDLVVETDRALAGHGNFVAPYAGR